ncbi:hypothetical protein GOQ29_05775 [Clostridium sp. D2Q-14]|uniref:hypothetical protein n=1 Tax=Anaeromonas gelatinilytica TaxID=2683194 RepID=UPI00193C0132|nr:hypothetical protein [Anaeromonas gelatinilytica]MBS4535127.1 hypothetical protein [Anaeromonas gelatinilytica]
MKSGLLWSLVALCIILILAYLYSLKNIDKKEEIRNTLKIMLSIGLVMIILIIIIINRK